MNRKRQCLRQRNNYDNYARKTNEISKRNNSVSTQEKQIIFARYGNIRKKTKEIRKRNNTIYTQERKTKYVRKDEKYKQEKQ